MTLVIAQVDVASSVEEGLRAVGRFVPQLLLFLVILVAGYFIAKAVAALLNGVLERVGFDRAVERGGVGQALAKSKYDASDILSKIVFWALFLVVLNVAFGVFGPDNPISQLIGGVIGYLPNVFLAIIIVVVSAAIAAAVKEIVEAALGGLSFGRALAYGASAAILVVGGFAALDQLNIAPAIVTGLFYAILAVVAGSAIVAIGGGGIEPMRQYWQRTLDRLEHEGSQMAAQSQGAGQRIQERAQERTQQLRAATQDDRPGGTTRLDPEGGASRRM